MARWFMFVAVPLCLAQPSVAAADKAALCTATAQVVHDAARARATGKQAARIKRDLTRGPDRVEDRLLPMVDPLVDWVFTVDAGDLGAPGAAERVTEWYRAGCMGFQP
ncbi:MAG: hypothetical protein ACE369_14205 [Roseovarius sp.]